MEKYVFAICLIFIFGCKQDENANLIPANSSEVISSHSYPENVILLAEARFKHFFNKDFTINGDYTLAISKCNSKKDCWKVHFSPKKKMLGNGFVVVIDSRQDIVIEEYGTK